MNLKIPLVNTKTIPGIVAFLKEEIPSILSTQCFNGNNFSFEKEVEATEIGHLFEHLLLDRLTNLNVNSPNRLADIEGRTDWDWQREPEGIFHIFIFNTAYNDLFKKALTESIRLLEVILNCAPIFAYLPELSSNLPAKKLSAGYK